MMSQGFTCFSRRLAAALLQLAALRRALSGVRHVVSQAADS